MALTSTKAALLGFTAPGFNLPDTLSGKQLTLADVRGGRATVIMFICNHCPYVKHVLDQLVHLGFDYKGQGVGFAAISSNDASRYPDDSPVRMKELGESMGFSFPYLYDELQEVARSYDAVCTPDFYIFDKELKCVYRGQLDGSRPGNGIPVSGRDIRNALDALIKGGKPSAVQKPGIGCSIKWK